MDKKSKLEEESIQILNQISAIPEDPTSADIIEMHDSLNEFFSRFKNLLGSKPYKKFLGSYEKTNAIINTQLTRLAKQGDQQVLLYKEKCKVMRKLGKVKDTKQIFLNSWSKKYSFPTIKNYIIVNGLDSISAVIHPHNTKKMTLVSFKTKDGTCIGTFDIKSCNQVLIDDSILTQELDKSESLNRTERDLLASIIEYNLNIYNCKYLEKNPPATASTETA